MTVARVPSALLSGLDVQPIGVEVDVRKGLPNFTIVGLAQDAVKESRDRVIAAIKNSGFEMPAMKVTINLTPVSLKKASPLLDLPIAAGVLLASKQIPDPPAGAVFLGELSLDGSVRAATGVLAILDGLGDRACAIIPKINLADAAILRAGSKRRLTALGIEHLNELARPVDQLPKSARHRRLPKTSPAGGCDFSDIRGQYLARRAAELSAAGGHHLLLVGPPGTGKSMLAHSLSSILPDLSPGESLEVTKIHHLAGILPDLELVTSRPFRSPHHTLSDVAMIGGGAQSLPGEITLAHRGVLFLDEFPEFHRHVIESLRQPLEDRRVQVSRAAAKISYPSDFILVCALNPCPCGYLHHPTRACRCSQADIRRYFNKLSGPILNRIDLQVELSPESADLILSGVPGECSFDILKRVRAVRDVQSGRFGRPDKTNAQMTPTEVRAVCALSTECSNLLQTAFKRMSISPRSLDKILKVSRTIADLANSPTLAPPHILEAIHFRAMDMLTTAGG